MVNISATTKLQVLLISVRQCDITHAEQLHTPMMLHYCAFQFRLPVKCYWWTNLPLGWDERIMLFYSSSLGGWNT